MAFQSTEHGARIIVEWNSTNQGNWTNHFWASKSSFTQGDMQTLAEEVAASLQNDAITGLAVSCGLANVRVVDEREEGAPQVIHTDASGGGASGAMVPISTTVCVTLRTARRGRAYRGRVYIAGFTENQIDDQTWTGAAVDQALDIVTAVQDACATTGWTFGVRSGQLNGVKRPQAIVTPVISVLSRSSLVTSQRRRNRRG